MEHVKHHFECNPEATEVFETSNGFLFESAGMADDHARTLKDKEVKTHLKASLTEDGEEELLFNVTETDEAPAGEEEVKNKDVLAEQLLLTEAPALETPVMQTTIFETPAAEATTEVSEEVETEVTEEVTKEEVEEVETKVEATTEVKEVAKPLTKAAAAKATSKAQLYDK